MTWLTRWLAGLRWRRASLSSRLIAGAVANATPMRRL